MPEPRGASVAGPGAGGLWLPPAVLLAAAAAGFALYNASPPPVANRAIYLYFASLVFAPVVVYPWMRRRGATVAQSVAGGLAVMLAWLVKEGHRITAVFSLGEAFYYALNPLAQGLFTAATLQMGLAELLLRKPWERQWRRLRGPAVVLGAVVLLAGACSVAGRASGGSEIFYTYVAIHGRIFEGAGSDRAPAMPGVRP